MKNLEKCLQRHNFNQDRFQTYICRMLFVGAVLAIIPSIMVAIINQSAPGCTGTHFTIYAHYSTHQWLTTKFEEFKQSRIEKYAAIDAEPDETCYELRIEDSPFSKDVNATIWIPETEIWIDLADDLLREEHADILNDGKLVENRSRDCTDITSIPFGIITWRKFAKFLLNFSAEDNTDPSYSPPVDAASYTIKFEDIIELAENGWQSYNKTKNKISDFYPDEDIDDLYFAHGHPNVTSGGLLGFVTAYSTYTASGGGKVFAFTEGPPECEFGESDESGEFETIQNHIEALESKIITTTPIDYSLPQLMKSKGPTYLHMAFGFENDVAYFNNLYREKLLYLWGDTLAFLYLENTYWLNHPMCKLTGGKWYTTKAGEVADEFVEWITGNNGSHIAALEMYGLRPFKEFKKYTLEANASGETILSLENGCVANIQPSDQTAYEKPSTPTSKCMMLEFAEMKKPLRLYILLDASSSMLDPIADDGTKWKAVPKSLPILPTNLADSSQISIACLPAERFEFTGQSCATTPYPNGTLEKSRSKIISYFANSLGTKSDNSAISLFIALNKTYNYVSEIKKEDTSYEYRYVILVISQPDSTDDEVTKQKYANSLLQNVGLSFDPNQIAIFSVLYYGESSSTSGVTLSTIASRTNGQFTTARTDIEDKLIEFSYYF